MPLSDRFQSKRLMRKRPESAPDLVSLAEEAGLLDFYNDALLNSEGEGPGSDWYLCPENLRKMDEPSAVEAMSRAIRLLMVLTGMVDIENMKWVLHAGQSYQVSPRKGKFTVSAREAFQICVGALLAWMRFIFGEDYLEYENAILAGDSNKAKIKKAAWRVFIGIESGVSVEELLDSELAEKNGPAKQGRKSPSLFRQLLRAREKRFERQTKKRLAFPCDSIEETCKMATILGWVTPLPFDEWRWIPLAYWNDQAIGLFWLRLYEDQGVEYEVTGNEVLAMRKQVEDFREKWGLLRTEKSLVTLVEAQKLLGKFIPGSTARLKEFSRDWLGTSWE